MKEFSETSSYVQRFEPAEKALCSLLGQQEKNPVLVAIDGRCGSGKTTLGSYLHERFGGNLFHMDDFYLRLEQRTDERMSEAGGNVDYERFDQEVLCPILEKKDVCYRTFSCVTWDIDSEKWIPYQRLNIIEGSYSLHPYFGNPYDLRIFMDIGKKEQIENIRERNGGEKLKQFQDLWIPKEETYFETFHIEEGCLNIPWIKG